MEKVIFKVLASYMKSFLFVALTVALFACKEASKPTINKPQAGSDTSIVTEDSTIKWIDYRMGELPPMGYYDGFDSIVRKWNLRYERVEGGCEMLEHEKKEYEKDNHKYFALLEQKHGKDWRKKFDAEVAAMDSVYQQENILKHINEPTNGITCKDKGGNMSEGFTTVCLYKNYSLRAAYNHFRKNNVDNDDGKFLEKEMPNGEHTAGFDEYPLSITYKYPKAKTLKIELNFPGGVTTLSFEQKKNGVQLKKHYSPD